MNDKEQIIKEYFHAWLVNDASVWKALFDPNTVYIECYGPEYHGTEQLNKWFADWNLKGKVLEWNIKQFIHQDNTVAVEWYFKCDYDNNVDGFDGASIITFNDDNKITSIKEFQSKALHYCPYGNGNRNK